MIVYKFGGASVKSAEGVKKLAEIVKNVDDNLVIVVSAMGKMTNALERLVKMRLEHSKDLFTELDSIFKFHYNICVDLFKGESFDKAVEKMLQQYEELKSILSNGIMVNYDAEYDKIVSYGELLSTILVSEYLNSTGIEVQWIDIRNVLITDSVFREANVEYQISEGKVNEWLRFSDKKNHKYITQGFIGSDNIGNTTTLGREGSDYTAALLANFLNADKLIVWKDVPGIMNADPAWYKNTEKISEMNYREAIELAFYGAKVIHPKTIKPLQNKNIPLEVRSFISIDEEGTRISAKEIYINQALYIFKPDQILISISNPDFSFILEDSLKDIFEIFASNKTKINVMQNSAVTFSVCCDYDEVRTHMLIDELRRKFHVLYNTNVALITIRHYTEVAIDSIMKGKKTILEQKSRVTAQFVYSEK
jgi:aspartate kinase